MTNVYDLSAKKGNRKKKRRKAVARDQTVWMGIDDHKDNFVVAILDDEQVIHREKLPKGKEHVDGLFERLPECKVWAAYEAGPTGYQMLRWLDDNGAEAGICAPLLVPTREGDDIKTDRRDALQLAKSLRGQMLEFIHDLGDQGYEDRELVRTRKQVVQQRADVCKQIRSKLMFHGVELPENLEGSSWSEAFLEWLSSKPSGRLGIDSSLETFVQIYRDLSERIDKLDADIRELAKSERYVEDVERLTTAPGVGVLTAMTFLVELGDISRFDNCEEFAAFLGLVPSESSTGETIRRGGLVRGGNRRVRTALVEASWQAIRYDDGLQEVYERIKRGHGQGAHRIAIVAVARRLALGLRAILRDEEGWRSPPKRAQKRHDHVEASEH